MICEKCNQDKDLCKFPKFFSMRTNQLEYYKKCYVCRSGYQKKEKQTIDDKTVKSILKQIDDGITLKRVAQNHNMEYSKLQYLRRTGKIKKENE